MGFWVPLLLFTESLRVSKIVLKVYHIDGLMQKNVTPLLAHWSYAFLALTHRSVPSRYFAWKLYTMCSFRVRRDGVCANHIIKWHPNFYVTCKLCLYMVKFTWYILWKCNACINMQPVCKIQWNLSVTTASKIKCITCNLFSNVFWWILNVPIYSC